ncbi:MAG: hypothetical protein ACUVQQ_09245 [Thermogutta sp.]
MKRRSVTDELHPYQRWLGFPAGRFPRDYYELFRLERFESDSRLIARQADIVIAEVRRIRPGPFAAEWAALLDELCTAKACLTDPGRKEVYDARLRSRGAQAGLLTETELLSPSALSSASSRPSDSHTAARTTGDSPAVETSPAPSTTVQATLLAEGLPLDRDPDGYLFGHRADRPPDAVRRNGLFRNGLDILYRTSALGLVVAAVLLAGFLVSRREAVRNYLRSLPVLREGTLASMESFQSVASPQDTLGTIDRPAGHPVDTALGTAAPDGRPPLASNGGPTPSNSGGSTLSPVGGDAAASLISSADGGSNSVRSENDARGDKAGAEQSEGDVSDLSPEFRADAHAVWQALAARDLPQAREKLHGLAAQVRNAKQRDCVAALDALLVHLEEFWRGVTDATASLRSTEELAIGETVVIVVEANRERITVRAAGRNRSYAVREMPAALVRAIVEQRFRKGRDTQVLLGAFLAVDPKGTPAEALRLWQAAQSAGTDVSLLIQALDYAPNGGPAPSATRLPIPDDAGELAKARQWVESQFPTAYQGTPSIPSKAEAARKMLEAAQDAALQDEAARYVLLRESARLAVESGEARLALQAVEALGARYAAEVARERRAVAESLSQSRIPESLHQRIASELLDAAKAALAAGDRDAARAMASAAVISARKGGNAALLRQALTVLQSAGGKS